jgi:flagellar biosynthesis protein FlhF
LIDTPGVGQRDQMVAEQDAMLAGAGVDIKRLLCLNATATGGTLNEVVHAYSSSGLAGCIITKLDEADLRIALKELRNKHTVLIDTVGVSQRDQMVAEQVAMLTESGADVKRLLCLNSTSTNETLNEVVRAYQGSGLAGCIMTKMDEAASIGNVLDVVIRQKLRLFYISNGQRVPEDLHLADKAMLVDRAFRLTRDVAATQYSDAELPLLMAQAGNSANDRSLREVSLG